MNKKELICSIGAIALAAGTSVYNVIYAIKSRKAIDEKCEELLKEAELEAANETIRHMKAMEEINKEAEQQRKDIAKRSNEQMERVINIIDKYNARVLKEAIQE